METGRGDVDTKYLVETKSRRRRGRDVDLPWRPGRGDAAAFDVNLASRRRGRGYSVRPPRGPSKTHKQQVIIPTSPQRRRRGPPPPRRVFPTRRARRGPRARPLRADPETPARPRRAPPAAARGRRGPTSVLSSARRGSAGERTRRRARRATLTTCAKITYAVVAVYGAISGRRPRCRSTEPPRFLTSRAVAGDARVSLT